MDLALPELTGNLASESQSKPPEILKSKPPLIADVGVNVHIADTYDTWD
jgi:hypothetical protein